MGKYSDCWTYPMEVIDEKLKDITDGTYTKEVIDDKLEDITDNLGTAAALDAEEIENTDIIQMKLGESSVFPRTNIFTKHIVVANATSVTLDLVRGQTAGIYCNILVFNANSDVLSLIATGTDVTVRNKGTKAISATIDGTDLTITRTDTEKLWGITDIYITGDYDIGTDLFFPE